MVFVKNEWIEWLSKIKWSATIVIVFLHCGAVYGGYLGVVSGKWETIVFGYVLAILSAIGTLCGAHRYFSHRSFKARWQLRVILMILQTLTGQRSIIMWAKEHRTHHKYTGTDADCANINRGFFFAHIGWLMTDPHPECQKRMDECDVSDLWADPIVRFQYDHYIPLHFLINIVIPTLLPIILFNDSLINGFFGTFMFRYVYTLHVSFCGNSVAHIWGTKPYDRGITATENDSLIYATLGGAYHNYHHVFPFDYSASELGCQSNFNFMTALIELFAAMGWAYDLRRAPKHVIQNRKQRTGDPIEGDSGRRRHPIVDWILGLTMSASALWILIALRITNRLFYLI